MDERIQRHARILTQYSVAARSKEVVTVDGTPEAEPLIISIHEELLKAGAYPSVRMVPEKCQENFYRHGKPHHFDRVSKLDLAASRQVDGLIRIMASSNTRSLADADPQKQARVSKADRKSVV